MQVIGPVRITWAAVAPTDFDGRVVAELDPHDRARAEDLTGDRRRQFLLGRELVVGLVGDLSPDAAGWSIGSRACARCGRRHAGVELDGVAAVAGVAHTRGLVVAVAAPSELVGGLGVDVEADVVDRVRAQDLGRLLGSSRGPVLRRWTRVEAVLKADGRGLMVDPGDVRLHRTTATIAGEEIRYRVADVAGPSGYVISLAWRAAGSGVAEAARAIR